MNIPARPSLHVAIASLVFVLLWSTGHVATRLGDPYIEPFMFLAIRFALSTVLVAAIALAIRAPWPGTWTAAGHIVVAGLLVHACYLGGVFVAIDLGLPAGTLAVITGLQPIVTGVLAASLLREAVSARQWSGLVLGFAGVALVVWEKAGFEDIPVPAFVAAFACLLAITVGTLYQKRFCQNADLISGNAIQLCVSATACCGVALAIETRAVDWSGDLVVAIAWQVVVLSAFSFSLFYWLLRQNEATRVTGLFYLMAPSTALMGYLLFGETFGGLGLLGMLVAVAGFWLVYRRAAPA
ncbi:MAG: DMT family transporter [Rhodospirillaceae bacterium]